MKYDVFFEAGQRKVVIARHGYGPVESDTNPIKGSFTIGGVDTDNNQVDPEKLASKTTSDHAFIAKAKEVLADAGIENLDNLTYEDQASNAPDHEDEDFSTESLPRTETGSDPEVSNQKGGTDSTAGTDPTTTAPNGVTPKDADADTTTDADQDQKETITQLKERIATITDKDELQKVYDDEVAGQDRAGAKAAIEARAGELADK